MQIVTEPNVTSSEEETEVKIYLDSKFLSDSPKANITINPLLEMLPLKEAILYGPLSCFIVTGYRGVGKTSFINYTRDKAKEEFSALNQSDPSHEYKSLLFVSCNFVNGDKKEHILRKLVRQLVTSVQEDEEALKILNTKPDLRDELNVLYKRTFAQVNDMTKETDTDTTTISRASNLSNAFIIMSIISLALVSNAIWNLILSFDLKYATGVMAIISILTTVYTYQRSSITENKSQKEIEVKTLYDDEIAETRLIGYIQRLRELGIKVIFTLDELDKIENDDQLDTFIGELKPILISGEATFILIAGQNLYYRLKKTLSVDDAVLPSIVADTYHISLPKAEYLIRLFSNNICLNETNISVYKHYLDSIILKTKRNPRKFINTLRNKVEWDKTRVPPKPYIKISSKNAKVFERDSKILECIERIAINLETGEQNLEHPSSQKDFLISQLHILAEQIKAKGISPFQLEDLLTLDEHIKSQLPKSYIDELNNIIGKFLNIMKNNGILYQDSETSNYTLKEIIIEENTLELAIKNFNKNMLQFERFICGIHSEIFKRNENTFYNVIKDLSAVGIIDGNTIQYIISIHEKCLSRGKSATLEEIRKAESNISSLSSVIIENYVYFVVQETLNQNNYSVNQNVRLLDHHKLQLELDIIAKATNNHSSTGNIIFEIKIGEINDRRTNDLVNLVQRRIAHLEGSNLYPCKFIIIFFTSNINQAQRKLLDIKLFHTALNTNISIDIIMPNIYRDLDKSLDQYLLEIMLKN
ncbi:hypothetical protein COD21_02240 [Bacillus cereus]|uniref:P-loop NTPase fold protein n=1 Tax=Bacillus cereus TaxID=1396 RepID=UPI000BFCB4BB|nr:P-loop NTPase fold protein [Bacillus cereus]PGU13410.1 hypothetical protein COD21_02240 [Bacillus cereus]